VQRVRELIREAKAAYPADTFFTGVDRRLRLSSQARAFYRAYDRALSYLDQESWGALSQKALAHFRDHRRGQLKQGFFNQLNDAFAYQYLVRRGNSRVRVLREGGRTTPDLSYFSGESLHHCEVKSIGISQEEVARRRSDQYAHRNSYGSLSDGFFNKLGSDLTHANSQISSLGTPGLVFIVATFDDATLTYYDSYRGQIASFLTSHPVPEVYVKVGVIGGRRIQKAGA
jgi:hypothetical protein